MKYAELKNAAKAEFENTSSMTWEMFVGGVTLKGIAPSEHKTLADVPLNKKVSTTYAIEVIRPDESRVIYVGSHSQPLSCRPGTGIILDHSNTLGVVAAVKNLWDGKIINFGDSDYAPFIAFAG